jgi:Phage stabilisation protein
VQIPILQGIFTDSKADFRASFPRNLIPVSQDSGISTGYLRPADGIVQNGTGPGINRGGILWNGTLYRVMGTSLVSVSASGTVTTLGAIPGTARVTMDYSFDKLVIVAEPNAYLFDGSVLTQITDPDLGPVKDVIWIDGYFMFIDDENIIVTELNDPFAIDPLKYGSSEADPDPLQALIKIRNEAYVLNRYTTEVFDNAGTSGFPFQRIEGAQIMKGAIGTFTCCMFLEAVAMVGGGENEAPAVWLASNGQAIKVSTLEIDLILQGYTEDELAASYLESRVGRDYQHLVFHLPRETIVYDAIVSQKAGVPAWFVLSSSLDYTGVWRVSDMVWAFDRWNVADTETAAVGYLVENISTHWGQPVAWEFSTSIIYNEGRGALIHELELVALTGRVALGADPRIYTQYTIDGVTWSKPNWISAGQIGNRAKRLMWLQQGNMRHWRAQRFRGTSDAFLSFARLEARIEALNF